MACIVMITADGNNHRCILERGLLLHFINQSSSCYDTSYNLFQLIVRLCGVNHSVHLRLIQNY